MLSKNKKSKAFQDFILFTLFLIIPPILVWINRGKEISIITKPHITHSISFDTINLRLLPDKYTLLLYHFDEEVDIFTFDESKNENNGKLVNDKAWKKNSPFKNAIYLNKNNFLKISDFPFDEFSPSKLKVDRGLTIEMILYIHKDQILDPNAPSKEKEKKGKNSKLKSKKKESYINKLNPRPTIINKYSDKVNKRSSYKLELVNLKKYPETDLKWTISFEDNKTINLNLKKPWQDIAESWRYIVLTYDGIYLYFYLDGQLVSKKKHIDKIAYAPNPIFIGKESSSSKGFSHITVDEFRISNIARSQKAIKKYWTQIAQKMKKTN